MSLGSPFLRTSVTIRSTMIDVLIALLPALIAGVFFFGARSLWVVLIATVTAVGCEALLLKHPFTIKGVFGDGSAAVTGMILGLILPSSVPFWVPVFGSILAIALVKLAFGGLGYNIFNPALAARAILLLGFTAPMVRYYLPFDTVTSATPLLTMSQFDWTLVWGNVPGSIGETAVLPILLGGIYLFYKGHIDWRIPGFYVGSAFLVALLWDMDPWLTITAGSLMFAAFFMATDMVTSPVTPMGRVIFGLGCGFLTVFIRKFTSFPEGVTFALLVMNAVVPLLDRLTVPLKFGEGNTREQRFQTTLGATSIILVAVGIFAVVGQFTPEYRPVVTQGAYLPLTETLGPGYQVYVHEGVTYYYAGSLEEPEQVGFSGSHNGYHGPVYFYVALDHTGSIEYLQILSHQEDPGLGSRVTQDGFLRQFYGKDHKDSLMLGNDIQGLTGATISSRAVISGVKRGLSGYMQAFFPSDDRQQAIGFVDGIYVAESQSYGGLLQVEVVIANQQISDVRVLKHSDTANISDPAHAKMPQRIILANSVDVDIVSGATVTSEAIVKAVKGALVQARPGTTPEMIGISAEIEEKPSQAGYTIQVGDGTYQGSAQGYGGTLEVEVTVVDGKISAITVISHQDTPFLADPAIRQLIPAILAEQGPVDTISGATAFSQGLLAAVEAAIGQGGGN